MHPILNKYRDVVVVNDERTTLALSLAFDKLAPERAQHFGGTHETGYHYHWHNPRIADDLVIEWVVNTHGESIASLYKKHPIFASVGELVRARDELTRAVAEKIGLSRESIGIDDAARGRQIGLEDMSTGQLIDMLAEQSGETIIAKTDSYGVKREGL